MNSSKPQPRLFSAGHALTQNGGHGDFRDRHEHHDPECPFCGHFVGLARVVDGVAEAFHKTRDELRQGADFIKVMGSGGMLSANQMTIKNTQFTPEEMRAITSTANAASTYVTVHAYSPDSIQQAVNNGARGIEHGNMLDRPTAKLMAKKASSSPQLSSPLPSWLTVPDQRCYRRPSGTSTGPP